MQLRPQQAAGYVFPAPAGINRLRRELFLIPGSVPRASGDKPGALDAMMDIT
ncbi:hypothetical protein [Escherichia coli]|uniref:hypothetical protein n=1 Tax=Escherichia coli TaxID=562 RepID=UPI004038BB1A